MIDPSVRIGIYTIYPLKFWLAVQLRNLEITSENFHDVPETPSRQGKWLEMFE